jgi:flagellar capping protein FliD
MPPSSNNSLLLLPWALIPVTAILTFAGTRKLASGYIKNLRHDYEGKLQEKQSKLHKDTKEFQRQYMGLFGKYKTELSRAEAALEENQVLQQQLNILKEQLQSSR